MTALVNYLETVVNSELNDEVFSAMDEIHNYLAKILDNNILMDTLYTINCHISRYRSLIENVTKTDLIAIKENHKKILSFILSKDKKAAREHIVKWNQTSMKFMRKRLKEAGLI